MIYVFEPPSPFLFLFKIIAKLCAHKFGARSEYAKSNLDNDTENLIGFC